MSSYNGTLPLMRTKPWDSSSLLENITLFSLSVCKKDLELKMRQKIIYGSGHFCRDRNSHLQFQSVGQNKGRMSSNQHWLTALDFLLGVPGGIFSFRKICPKNVSSHQQIISSVSSATTRCCWRSSQQSSGLVHSAAFRCQTWRKYIFALYSNISKTMCHQRHVKLSFLCFLERNLNIQEV